MSSQSQHRRHLHCRHASYRKRASPVYSTHCHCRWECHECDAHRLCDLFDPEGLAQVQGNDSGYQAASATHNGHVSAPRSRQTLSQFNISLRQSTGSFIPLTARPLAMGLHGQVNSPALPVSQCLGHLPQPGVSLQHQHSNGPTPTSAGQMLHRNDPLPTGINRRSEGMTEFVTSSPDLGAPHQSGVTSSNVLPDHNNISLLNVLTALATTSSQIQHLTDKMMQLQMQNNQSPQPQQQQTTSEMQPEQHPHLNHNTSAAPRKHEEEPNTPVARREGRGDRKLRPVIKQFYVVRR